jgi:hypothetical protein
MENPFEIKVYDKNFAFKGYIGNPVSLIVTPRLNDTGSAIVEIDMTHRLAPVVLEDGARMVISKDGQFVLSGRIYQKSSEGPSVTATLKLTVLSDFQLMKQILAWPDPAADVLTQANPDMKGTYTAASAEELLKLIVTQNMITRLGLPVTCGPALGRGDPITADEAVVVRFDSLFEKLFPLMEQKGLCVTFQQSGAGVVCDVFTPPVYKFTLTEESGVLQSWSWSSTEPVATRIVAGSRGAATDTYVITQFGSDAMDPPLEPTYGTVIESYEDISDADTQAKLDAAAAKKLEEKIPRSGFTVRLAETQTFRYGEDNLVVGALVTISVGGVTRTDYLREVTMTYSREAGVQVTPMVGDIQDNADRKLGRFLARLQKSINQLKVRK